MLIRLPSATRPALAACFDATAVSLWTFAFWPGRLASSALLLARWDTHLGCIAGPCIGVCISAVRAADVVSFSCWILCAALAGNPGAWSKPQHSTRYHTSTIEALLSSTGALCSVGAAASGSTFVPRKDGLSCNSICSSQGLTSATQRSSDSPVETSVCAANVTGQGMLSGFQQGGNGTCNVVSKGEAATFDEYSCLCLDSQAMPGLAAAEDSTCSSACSSQSFDGLTGSAVSTDSSEPSFTCVPSTEIGEAHRPCLAFMALLLLF